jgi:hypothetical protein
VKNEGDLYWRQLSMWDCSKPENTDVYNSSGFHYELMVIKKVISDNQWTVRNIKCNELTTQQIKSLTPLEGQNWTRVMGNISNHKLTGERL